MRISFIQKYVSFYANSMQIFLFTFTFNQRVTYNDYFHEESVGENTEEYNLTATKPQ